MQDMKYDVIIVGCGLFGAVVAYCAKKKGLKCLILERRNVSGGNVYDEPAYGFYVSKYGAHIFHTDNERVWKFMNRFSDFNSYTHRVLAESGGGVFHMPISAVTFREVYGIMDLHDIEKILKLENEAEFYDCPRNLEEKAVNLIGRRLYELLIKGYTEKQWGKCATELPKEIIERLPVRRNFDTRYFCDQYQGMPINGYTDIINRMTDGIEIIYGADFNKSRHYWTDKAKKIVYTGMIDELMDFKYGALEYRSLKFETMLMEQDFCQPAAVVNYADKNIPYTRIIEHKRFYNCMCLPYTIITKEYPAEWSKGKEAFYPINDKRNRKLYEKYRQEAKAIYPNIVPGGRLGCYEYNDMDDTVEKALELSDMEFVQ